MLVRLSSQRLLAQPIPNTTRQTSQSPTGLNSKGEPQLGRQHATTHHPPPQMGETGRSDLGMIFDPGLVHRLEPLSLHPRAEQMSELTRSTNEQDWFNFMLLLGRVAEGTAQK
jgi:hypothetical protein